MELFYFTYESKFTAISHLFFSICCYCYYSCEWATFALKQTQWIFRVDVNYIIRRSIDTIFLYLSISFSLWLFLEFNQCVNIIHFHLLDYSVRLPLLVNAAEKKKVCVYLRRVLLDLSVQFRILFFLCVARCVYSSLLS